MYMERKKFYIPKDEHTRNYRKKKCVPRPCDVILKCDYESEGEEDGIKDDTKL